MILGEVFNLPPQLTWSCTADDEVAVFATLRSIPRTLQAAWWAAQAGLAYKRVAAQYPDTHSQQYKDALSQTPSPPFRPYPRSTESGEAVFLVLLQVLVFTTT